jgi:hypothetical protein
LGHQSASERQKNVPAPLDLAQGSSSTLWRRSLSPLEGASCTPPLAERSLLPDCDSDCPCTPPCCPPGPCGGGK